jgi:hypothetical protein
MPRPGAPWPAVLVLVVLAVALGGSALVHGEADDSPGLQAVGLLLAVGAPALALRRARRRG